MHADLLNTFRGSPAIHFIQACAPKAFSPTYSVKEKWLGTHVGELADSVTVRGFDLYANQATLVRAGVSAL